MATLTMRDTKRILHMIDPSLNYPLLDYIIRVQAAQPVGRSRFHQQTREEEEEEEFFRLGPRFISSGCVPWSAESAAQSPQRLLFKYQPK